MKFKLFFVLFIFLSAGVIGQQIVKTFPVSGNCGMCKKTIEASAMKQGVSVATWDKVSQMLSVSFDSTVVSEALIKQSIADAGYDADGVKANDVVYNALPDCCKYRSTNSDTDTKAACCVKDGVCKGEKKCCKRNSGDKSCCEKATCEKANGCCSQCKKGGNKKCCAADDKACDKKGDKKCCKEKKRCKSEDDGCKH